MCNIHCDRIAAFNCCRGLSILILIIVIDFIRNETLRLFGIMSIVIIVMSFICYDTSHLRRTQANRRRNEGRNEENNRDIIVLEIINRNIDREVLNLLRTRTFSYKLGHTDPHIGDECCICLDEYKKKSKVSRLECCHIFHKKCIEKWLLEKPICPLCKFDIFEDIIVVEDDSDIEERIYIDDE